MNDNIDNFNSLPNQAQILSGDCQAQPDRDSSVNVAYAAADNGAEPARQNVQPEASVNPDVHAAKEQPPFAAAPPVNMQYQYGQYPYPVYPIMPPPVQLPPQPAVHYPIQPPTYPQYGYARPNEYAPVAYPAAEPQPGFQPNAAQQYQGIPNIPPQYPITLQQDNSIPPTGQPAKDKADGKKGAGLRITLTIVGIIFGLAMLFFAIYGVIAMVDDIGSKKAGRPSVPEYSQQMPDGGINPGNRLPDFGNRLPDFGNQLPDNGNQLPEDGNQLPEAGNDFSGGLNSPKPNPSDLKLGIVVSEVTEQQVMLYQVPKGLVILQISEDSSLNCEEIKQYDIIVKADGTPTETSDELHAIFKEHEAGDTIKLTITRVKEDGTLYTFDFDAKLQANDEKQTSGEQSAPLKGDDGISRPSV